MSCCNSHSNLRIVYRLPRKSWLRWNHGVILIHKIYLVCVKLAIRWAFYICSEKQFKPEWVDLYHATVINRIGSKMYFVTVTKGMVLPELEIEMAKLPDSSLSALQAKVTDLKAQQTALQEKLKDLAVTVIPDLKAAQHQVHSQIEFSKVVLNTDTFWPTIN